MSQTLKTPAGTYGLSCEPWARGEFYAVAANWADASAPVLAYGPDGWVPTGSQVADYRHSARAALAAVIREAMTASGSSPDEDEVVAILDDGVDIDAGEGAEK